MQMHPITFPPDRRNDPKRRAEARVFDEINASRLPGFVHYEWQRDHKSPQLDFALWLLNVGRFGVDIKGGHYSLEKGKWYLKTDNGPQKKECPLRKAWDATMSFHDELVDVLEHEAFSIAVLVFPDMEPDQAITAKAERSNVHVLWGHGRPRGTLGANRRCTGGVQAARRKGHSAGGGCRHRRPGPL